MYALFTEERNESIDLDCLLIVFKHVKWRNIILRQIDCFGRKLVKVLTQDLALLHGVIAYARPHYHAG